MEQCPEPYAEMHPALASKYGLEDGDLVKLITPRSHMIVKTKLTKATRRDTVFVPYHWGKELAVNQLTNPCLDPISRMPEFKVCALKLEKQH